MNLYDYQEKLIADVRERFRIGDKSVLVQSATGSGKTVTMAYIARQTASRGGRVLILVHRKELLDQTCKTLEKVGVQYGVIMSGRTPSLLEPVQVGTIGTVANRLDRIGNFSLIIPDECHHTVSKSYLAILNNFPQARIIGFTATPERLDGKGLGRNFGGVFDSMVSGLPVAELIQRGFLSRPVYYVPPGVATDGMGKRGGDYKREEAEARSDKPTITGSAVDHYLKYLGGSPAIAFCCTIKHAHHVAETFRASGFRSAVIDGTLSDKDRRDRVRDLASGALNVLTSCEIVSEGFDVPVVAGSILLRPTMSLVLHLQQIGRALRIYPGKDHAVILDHVGNCARLGYAEDVRDWSLEGAEARKRKQKEDNAPKYRQCSSCYNVHPPAPECPSCGFVYPVIERKLEEVSGNLVAIGGGKKYCPDCGSLYEDYFASCNDCGFVFDAVRARKKQQGKAQTLDELIAVARLRNYRNPRAWAMHVINGRKGKKSPVKEYFYM